MLPFEISSILYELTIRMLISAIHFFLYGASSRSVSQVQLGFYPWIWASAKTKLSFSSFSKEQKILPFCRHCRGPILPTWAIPGTGLGCLFNLLFTRPCLSHGIIFGWCILELAQCAGCEPFHRARPSWHTAAWLCFPPQPNLRMFPQRFAPLGIACVALYYDDFGMDLPPLLDCEFLQDSHCVLFFCKHQTWCPMWRRYPGNVCWLNRQVN